MTSRCLLASMWILCARCTLCIGDVNCLFLFILKLISINLSSKNRNSISWKFLTFQPSIETCLTRIYKKMRKIFAFQTVQNMRSKSLCPKIRDTSSYHNENTRIQAINGHILPPSSCTSRRSPVAQSGANQPETDSRTGPSENIRRQTAPWPGPPPRQRKPPQRPQDRLGQKSWTRPRAMSLSASSAPPPLRHVLSLGSSPAKKACWKMKTVYLSFIISPPYSTALRLIDWYP